MSIVAVALFALTPAHAQPQPSLEEVLKELRQLRGEVGALRLALAQLAELDRQRASVIARSLDAAVAPPPAESARVASAAPPPLPPLAPAPMPAPATPPVTAPNLGAPRTPPAAVAARVTASGGSGTIGGKVVVPSGEPVAYVYVENIRGPATQGETVTMEQLRKQFAPRWAVIRRGTTIEFPNLDNVYHNVFSRSTGNSFDLGLYNSSDKAKSHTFVTAGPVDIYCNIHPEMAARVLVVPNAFFAKVRPDGTFSIAGVPAGKRKVVAWSPGTEETSTWIELDSGGSAEVALELVGRSEAHLNKQGRPYGSYP